jgi:serine/threonine-protein kinase RsbW
MIAEDFPCAASGELRLAAHASTLRMAREYARRAAAEFGLDAASCEEFVFAVNEAVTNAIRHGAPDEDGRISLSAVVGGDRLTLSVRDYGTFVGSAPNMNALAESGRGFTLMAHLTDAVQLCVGKGGTTVRLSRLAHQHPTANETR